MQQYQGGDEELDNPLQAFLIQEDLSGLTKGSKKSSSETITIYIKCVYPNPLKPGEMIQILGSQTCNSSDKVESVAKKFLETYPEIPQNKEYYLGYDQLLFREGTLHECGITHGKSVDLYAPGKNAAAYHNEGLSMIIWALIPFAIGFACLLFSITSSQIDTNYQALFLFVGLLLDIPSTLILIIGFILLPTCPMPCYFIGTEWC
ncbi:hypothetical protein TRFO_16735 [Tritrichomonas foetus]|uniref:Ubiquitin-like domain-containing protein n=1 Tax=Tritrichomonas foetus TaxID=1144522 RepID=A0A1J4KPG3_9EUKA|nr:hypothetical protein TRFO_16735 [Tritrichomonas foetus]|eukprot:OHT13183.1 hypothetical protein TRFO_16735 [Tritrichomonas foetus]